MLSQAESTLRSQRSLTTTVPDTVSEHESLALRRMTSTLVDALSSFNIEGDGRLEWDGSAGPEPMDARPSDGVGANALVGGGWFGEEMDTEGDEEVRGRTKVRPGESVMVW
jgi:hypothetical protein